VASLDNAGTTFEDPVKATPVAAHAVAPHASARVASVKASAAPTKQNVRQHKVRSGDTLFSVAKQYSTSVDSLRALNNLKGNNLKVGSTLRVPGTNVRS
jgi:membrane-bound lytic murein transglycosylase D